MSKWRCRGIPEWPLPFWLKAHKPSTSSKVRRHPALSSSNTAVVCKEEPDPLFYHLPLSRVFNRNRWWHLIAKTVQLVLRKKTWAAIGSHLKVKKGNLSESIVRLRKLWHRESRELKRIKLGTGAGATEGFLQNTTQFSPSETVVVLKPPPQPSPPPKKETNGGPETTVPQKMGFLVVCELGVPLEDPRSPFREEAHSGSFSPVRASPCNSLPVCVCGFTQRCSDQPLAAVQIFIKNHTSDVQSNPQSSSPVCGRLLHNLRLRCALPLFRKVRWPSNPPAHGLR